MDKITKEKVRAFMPTRNPNSYKGSYGRVLLVGGNENMGGAVILAASAAVYSGAGLVTVATHPSNKSALHAQLPEAMFVDMTDTEALKRHVDSVDMIVLGPGLGRDEMSKVVLQTVYQSVSSHQTLLVDGDGIYLHVNEEVPEPSATLILTPHLGEWRTLTGLSPDDQYDDVNVSHAKKLNAIVVLKKSRTEVYCGEETWKNTTGNPSMSTGGMGDTLAGMIGGFVPQFDTIKEGVLAAVYLHSYIADELSLTQYVTLPTAIIKEIPTTMKDFTTDKHRRWL
ncbi:NAD(P)H-hydrate dehydratase [Alkalibacterium kapii]|uniref:ADP-dependent (S)-NAD(P)H-hydrate dehydratase n=1 Tax=Alkalibacterium kapii TaxID=426704 RepID=A0A511ASZ8_9LACT|nr:NAD(P)H-hydrate dehydratase [Alkalibacterium kapii]GEK91324.1 ADP-dependent (S)-NAD(P)H-hydrate dehydratase [Alkalibacterium kapii]